MSTLPKEFYLHDTVKVAKKLLGKKIIRTVGRQTISGTIIETEAYKHKDDPASHAYRRVTERNKAMFGEVGRAYVYFTYGMYYCFNIVARDAKTEAGAVLIRAIKPENGIEIMKRNRKNANYENLTNGPAKLAQAMQITNSQYGIDLTKKGEIFISDGPTPKKIESSPRIGIRLGTEKNWNFKTVI